MYPAPEPVLSSIQYVHGPLFAKGLHVLSTVFSALDHFMLASSDPPNSRGHSEVTGVQRRRDLSQDLVSRRAPEGRHSRSWGALPHSPEHPVLHAVARRQLTPFLEPAEPGALVGGHGAVELHAGPGALGLLLGGDLNGVRGSCWAGRGREGAGGACRDTYEVLHVCV